MSRSLADKDGSLKSGDLVLKINNHSLDNLSLKDAKKILESAKERLELVIRKPGSSEEDLKAGNRLESPAMGPVPPRGPEDPPPRPPMPYNNEGKLANL